MCDNIKSRLKYLVPTPLTSITIKCRCCKTEVLIFTVDYTLQNKMEVKPATKCKWCPNLSQYRIINEYTIISYVSTLFLKQARALKG